MTQKTETTFSNLLHSKLSPEIYYEKTNNPYRRGMPDFYYESKGPILWAEHKYILKPWNKDRIASDICPSSSWSTQRRWLVRAHQNGKQAIVIIGVGSGKQTKGYILTFPYTFSVEENTLLTLEQITQYIEEKTNAIN